MTRIVITALAASLLLAGCASAGPARDALDSRARIETVPGPTENVTSLVLHPTALAPTVDAPGTPVRLAFGAYLARMTDGGQILRHLGLLIQLQGPDRALELDLARGLLVELDGVQYVADLALTGNSFLMQPVEDGRRLTLSFPVDREGLERLTRAREVRLSVGGSSYFRLTAEDRARLRAFTDQLPPDEIDGVRSMVAVAETDS